MNKHVLGQSIEDDPLLADQQSDMGYWEGNLVRGEQVASEPAIMTLTERVGRYESIVKVGNYHVETCRQGPQNITDNYGSEFFKTITFDNGSEFSQLN